MSRSIVAAACLIMVAGCGTDPAELPQRSRPSELPVLNLDLCSVMPREVVTALRVGPAPHAAQTPFEAPPGTHSCGWDRSVSERPSASLLLSAVPITSFESVTSPDADQTEIVGFPAAQMSNRRLGANSSCELFINVAQDEALLVSYYNTLGDEVGATHELMCERAHRAAEGVMQQLLATRK